MPSRPSLNQLRHGGCGGIRVCCRRSSYSTLPMLICLLLVQHTHRLSLSTADGSRLVVWAYRSANRSSRASMSRCVRFVRAWSLSHRARPSRWIRRLRAVSRRPTRCWYAPTTLPAARSSVAGSTRSFKMSKRPQSTNASLWRSSSHIPHLLHVACLLVYRSQCDGHTSHRSCLSAAHPLSFLVHTPRRPARAHKAHPFLFPRSL